MEQMDEKVTFAASFSLTFVAAPNDLSINWTSRREEKEEKLRKQEAKSKNTISLKAK